MRLEKAQAIVALPLDGYSQDEIRELVDATTVRAVEGSLYRWRTKAKQKRRGTVMTNRDDEFTALLNASSLGTDAARRLRERTPQNTAKAIRTITHLRNTIVYGTGRVTEQDVTGILTALGSLTSDDIGLRRLHDAVACLRAHERV
ncbi:hypothetical protein [Streptomyces sp. YIM B13518]|uniref:hypothetical protein n=1 Tax=Streptomyces sp. YIM B13518 TaxID=3366316 RepID=UPI0036A9E21F